MTLTRYKELGLDLIGGDYRFFDLTAKDHPAPVGPYYATKAEALADLDRYASMYGCELAMPYQPEVPNQRLDKITKIATLQGRLIQAGKIYAEAMADLKQVREELDALLDTMITRKE